MSRIWDVQLQLVTPEDVELQEIEEKLVNFIEEAGWDQNYSNSVLIDEYGTIDEEDSDNRPG